MTDEVEGPPEEAIAAAVDVSAVELVRIRRLLLMIVLLATFTAVYFSREVLLPIVLAIVMTLTLLPAVRAGERLHIPRFVTSIALILCIALSIFLAGYFLSGPIGQLVEDAPEIADQLRAKFDGIMDRVSSLREATAEVTDAAAEAAAQAGAAAGQAATGETPDVVAVVAEEEGPNMVGMAVSGLASASGSVFAALLLTLFLLAAGDFYHRRIVEAAPKLRDKKKALTIIRDVERQISRYLGAIFVINLGLGVLVGSVLWALGMPMAVVWAVLAFLLNFIPFVGNLLTVVLVGAVALVTYDTLWQALLPPLAVIVISGLESNVVTPILVGRRLELNQVAQLITLAFWTWLWGVPGAILAVPFLVVVKAVCDNVESLQTLGSFLSGDPTDRPHEAPQKATTGPALESAPLRTQAEARADSPPTHAPGEERVTPLIAS